MNRIVALSLLTLIAFASHTYASVLFKPAPLTKEVQAWLKDCKKFQKVMPDVQQFFGCPTIENFTFSKGSVSEVADAINQILKIKTIKSNPKKAVKDFVEKLDGDFYSSFDLVREVEESDEDIRFNKSVQKKFANLSLKFETLINKESSTKSAFYDENATWNGNLDGKPVEAEALVLIDLKTKSVSVYRVGYYYDDTI